MDGVGKPFHVNVDLSKVLNKTVGTNFIMLIDEAKMTIVYEMIEWIRWMFSIKGCVYLTHENSVIHELEDIRILQALKVFELKPCNTVGCIHKETYCTLLSNIDFFMHWNQVKVPKIFVEKLNIMNQKRCCDNQNTSTMITSWKIPYSKGSNIKEKSNPTNDKETGFHNHLGGDHIMKGKESFNNDTETCQSDKSEAYKNQKWKFFNGSEIIRDINIVAESNKHNNDENSNSVRLDSVGNKFSNNKPKEQNKNISNGNSLSDKNFSEFSEPLSVDNLKVIKKDSSSNKKKVNPNSVLKKNRSSKPFSLAALVANLREETEKQVDKVKKTISQDSSSIMMEENGTETEMYYGGLECEVPSVKKKRKRVRRPKSKKKKETEFEEVFQELIPVNDDKLVTFAEKKSTHIRFTSSSEEDDISTKLQDEGVMKKVNNIEENIKKSEAIQNNEVNLCNLFLVTSEKKQVLSSSDSNAVKNCSSRNFDNLMDCTPVETNESYAENVLLDDQNSGLIQNSINQFKTGPENYNDSSINDEFTSMKNKFPFPKIFERFY